MEIPTTLKYTKNDEWLSFSGTRGTIGITDFAQEQLSDIVFVEVIVSIGDAITANDQIATIESVKAAADVYSPVSGEVVEINQELPDSPEIINNDPYGAAWLIKIEISNPGEIDTLLDSNTYKNKIDSQEG